MRLAVLATSALNQWALDFDGNLKRICESIRIARNAGATYRVGPELEVTGYGCEDHFHELDTERHAWEVVAELIRKGYTDNMVVDLGMPVWHRDVCYNCRVFCLDRKILLVRPKVSLADDGLYREPRWFRAWPPSKALEDYRLPDSVRGVTNQLRVPFGEAILDFDDGAIAAEACEELFTLDAPHVRHALSGVDIISNGSGSLTQLRKLDTRVDLIRSAAKRGGGVYLYSNQLGCDGGRAYYDGCALVAMNGEIVRQGQQFLIDEELEVLAAIVDLDSVRSYRNGIASRSVQAAYSDSPPRIKCHFKLCMSDSVAHHHKVMPDRPISATYLSPEEEIASGPACWLWDYLRRSGASGFLLPLSGGADSSAVAAIVGSMAQMVVRAVENGSDLVLGEIRRVLNDSKYTPGDHRELMNRLLTTVYMSSDGKSSPQSRDRARRLAKELGSNHVELGIDTVVSAFLSLIAKAFPSQGRPRFLTEGGSCGENLALQNLQARLRMVTSYLIASLLPWMRANEGKPSGSFILVLGSSNVDEALRGYYTKYDCSSADLNPIGSLSKTDLRLFLRWAKEGLGYETLVEVAEAAPTAELEPITGDHCQSDEADMGMSYHELGWFGPLRKIERCGPVAMFLRLLRLWDHLDPSSIAEKTQHFFTQYSRNRHKMTTLTPSYHAESYSPDDNRHDLRQIFYNNSWTWQFRRMDHIVEQLNNNDKPPKKEDRENGQSPT